jgi:CDP-glycerol glycerophosphotransferase
LGADLKLLSKVDKKMILYAPTYRENNQDIGRFISALKDIINCFDNIEYFELAIKPHPAFVSETGLDFRKLLSGRKNLIYIDCGEDIYPWAARADFLITDYSSIYYDFLITKKPIVFFRPDVDHYDSTRTRVVYPFETEFEPGPVVTDAAEILSALSESESVKWKTNRAALANKLHTLPHDGRATKRVADFILSLLRI